jgi:thiol:disulfide interchange protein/DsbC/DsbD-like thiol-disulfide interchange protein
MRRLRLLLLLLFVGLFPNASLLQVRVCAQETAPTANCVPSLVADTQAVQPGHPFQVLVRFQLAKGWHLYWQFPGDSGAPPSILWQLPEGFEAGPIHWPVPELLASEGDLRTYVFHDELALLVEIRPPAQISTSSVPLKAKLKWFICAETCMPGRGEVSLELPVGPASPSQAELFKAAKDRLPLTSPAPFSVAWKRTAAALEVSVTGLPPGESLDLFPIPPKGVSPGKINRSTPTPTSMLFTLPLSDPDPAGAFWAGLFLLKTKEGPPRAWELSSHTPAPTATATATATAPATAPTPSPTPSGVSSTPEPPRGVPPPPPPPPSQPGVSSLAAVLWSAFLGGLLLNLMPCVLPVIALKIFGFTQQAGQQPGRVMRLGLAFTAGVFTFFLGLGAAVIALKAAGSGLNWGFQFQNPWILVGLISAVFVFGMNLLGVFEITLASGASAKLSELSAHQGYGGAFLHGMFTTLLGTSCTAPYLGVTLGFAVSQPAPRVLLIFCTIAAGMSLPYLLLTANPALLRFLPKPGAWMDRLKQLMGFVMLAVAVWLLGVLGQSRGLEAFSGASAFLLLLGFACWFIGVWHSRPFAWLAAVLLAALGFQLFLLNPLSQAPTSKASSKASSKANIDDPWEPFSPERLAAERASGHSVFVDFTADWCLNCKVNERVTLSKPEVLAAFKKRGVTLLKADWTNGDPTITAELNRFQRVGVPFYLLYAPTGQPTVFPELITPSLVLEALEKLP